MGGGQAAQAPNMDQALINELFGDDDGSDIDDADDGE